PLPRRLRQDGRTVRRPRRFVRCSHPAVQHDHLYGTPYAERPAVLRAIRARGNGRADPRQDRRLLVNRAEAATVKHLYERYLELGSVRLLRNDLERRGIVSKVRMSKNGVRSGGRQFSRGALYQMLSNPIYLGEIRHKKERHQGQHAPIVSRELWEKVQRRLRDQAAARRERPTKAPFSPLAGKLFEENGEPLYVQGAVKGARHYRYYVSRGLVRGSIQDGQRGWRVAAPELER